uniref:Uncharacterized protein n=2 Tax=Vibrio sp. 23023 TaxID=452803 RepID=A9M4S8_9VIBR|nr:Hypothetical protein BMSA_0060 [Vibrio sp. 23023]
MTRTLLIALVVMSSAPTFAKPLSNIDPLAVAVRTVWDKDINTVGDAARWIVEPQGFHITTQYPAPRDAASIAAQPIPPSMKMKRTMPVLDAIQLLIGVNNTIIIDREHQLISFGHGVLDND